MFADKLNYSLWLSRLDDDKSDDRIVLIKALFISVKSNQSFNIFVNPPPKDLSELNVEQYDNPVIMWRLNGICFRFAQNAIESIILENRSNFKCALDAKIYVIFYAQTGSTKNKKS